MRYPPLSLAVVVNAVARAADEWDGDDSDLHRLRLALAPDDSPDQVTAAARLAYRVAHTQAFGEGNKRTALLLARWLLDHNDVAADVVDAILPGRDPALARLLISAAAGNDTEAAMVTLLRRRAAPDERGRGGRVRPPVQ